MRGWLLFFVLSSLQSTCNGQQRVWVQCEWSSCRITLTFVSKAGDKQGCSTSHVTVYRHVSNSSSEVVHRFCVSIRSNPVSWVSKANEALLVIAAPGLTFKHTVLPLNNDQQGGHQHHNDQEDPDDMDKEEEEEQEQEKGFDLDHLLDHRHSQLMSKRECHATNGFFCEASARCADSRWGEETREDEVVNFLCNKTVGICLADNAKCDQQIVTACRRPSSRSYSCLFPTVKKVSGSLAALLALCLTAFVIYRHRRALTQRNMKRYRGEILKRKDIVKFKKKFNN